MSLKKIVGEVPEKYYDEHTGKWLDTWIDDDEEKESDEQIHPQLKQMMRFE